MVYFLASTSSNHMQWFPESHFFHGTFRPGFYQTISTGGDNCGIAVVNAAAATVALSTLAVNWFVDTVESSCPCISPVWRLTFSNRYDTKLAHSPAHRSPHKIAHTSPHTLFSGNSQAYSISFRTRGKSVRNQTRMQRTKPQIHPLFLPLIQSDSSGDVCAQFQVALIHWITSVFQ